MNTNFITRLTLDEKPAPGDYLSELPLVRWLSEGNTLEFRKPVTFLVGENGSGKSTLLEAIAVASGFNPEGGSRNYQFSTADSHSRLHEMITLTRTVRPRDGFFLRAESFYNAAAYLDSVDDGKYAAYGGQSLMTQSHGESFLALMKYRFFGNGLYLLDEPEAALSPQRQLSLLCILDELVKKNSQFVIATHSPILMAYPDAEILEFNENGIEPKEYKETDHYKLTRRFLEDPERMLKLLLEEDN